MMLFRKKLHVCNIVCFFTEHDVSSTKRKKHMRNAVTKWIKRFVFLFASREWTLLCYNFILNISFWIEPIFFPFWLIFRRLCNSILFVVGSVCAEHWKIKFFGKILFLHVRVHCLTNSYVFLFNFRVIISFKLKHKHFSKQMWYVYMQHA